MKKKQNEEKFVCEIGKILIGSIEIYIYFFLLHFGFNQYLWVSIWVVQDEIFIYELWEWKLPWLTYLNKVYGWFEERHEIEAIANNIISKYIPPCVNIFYCLGGITFTYFFSTSSYLKERIIHTNWSYLYVLYIHWNLVNIFYCLGGITFNF